MRVLGIDFGERRIGVAISDPEGRLAVPLATLERRSDRAAADELAELVRRERAEALVVGEPRNLDGSRGEAARRARRFAERLARATGLPCEMVDEALTSVEAESRLAAAGGSGRRRSRRLREAGRVDQVAAQILLQDALDRGAGEGR